MIQEQREKKARLLALLEGIEVERAAAGRPIIIDAQGQTRGAEPALVCIDELPDDWDVELF